MEEDINKNDAYTDQVNDQVFLYLKMGFAFFRQDYSDELFIYHDLDLIVNTKLSIEIRRATCVIKQLYQIS